jgi:serine/threonine protein kinase
MAPRTPRPPGLTPGSVAGGRFEVERPLAEDAIGTLLAATDVKTRRPITLRVLKPGLIATPEAREILKAEIRAAAALGARSAVKTFGMGVEGSALFLATERVEGKTLAQLVRDKQGGPMSLRGILNVVIHVSRALEEVRKQGRAHGAVRPSRVTITPEGRVELDGFGLDRALLQTAGPASLGPAEAAFLAPEVRGGDPGTPASDVFGLGGLLYAMLTKRSAGEAFINPSEVHPEATVALDTVLMTCLAPNPEERFANCAEVRDALLNIVGDAAEAEGDDFGVAVEMDAEVESRRPPPPPPRPRPSGSRLVAAAPPAAAPAVAGPADPLAHDAPRWMVAKGGLDHGPFTGRELIQQILRGGFGGEDDLSNMDTGERRPLGESPEFAEFVEQARQEKRKKDERAAVEVSVERERKSTTFKGAVLFGGLAVVALVVVAFVLTLSARQEDEEVAMGNLADMYAAGEIEIEASAELLPPPDPRRRGRRRRATGSGGGGMSYEDAMNQVVDLGNAASPSGSSRGLSPQEVQRTMDGNLNAFVRCVGAEQRAGRGVGLVTIDLAIGGNGQVLGTSVSGGSPQLQRCVAARVRQLRFPESPAPRTAARYRFEAG